MTLPDHLSACVRERNGIPSAIGARVRLRKAIQTDPALRSAAEARLAEITFGATPIVERCHIAKCEQAALKETLGV